MKNYAMMVQNELENLKSTLSDEEFFSSDMFFRFLENYINGVVKGFQRGKKIQVKNMYLPKSELTARTNGYLVENNTCDHIIQQIKTRYGKYYANLGKVCHEIWHILFTNFQTHASHVKAWQSDDFDWLVQPKHEDSEKVKEAINENPNIRKLMYKLFLDVSNIYEDAYINIKGTALMPGVPATGFTIYNDTMVKEYGDLNKIMDIKMPIIVQLLQIMHLQSMGKNPIATAPLDGIQEGKYEIISGILEDAKPYSDALLYMEDGMQRARLVDEVLICMFPLVELLASSPEQENEEKNSPDGSGENSSENGDISSENSDISDEDVEKIIQGISENLSETTAPTGSTTPINEKMSKEEFEDAKEKMSETSSSLENTDIQEMIKKAFESIETSIEEKMSKKIVEEKHSEDLSKESKDVRQSIRESIKKDIDSETMLPPSNQSKEALASLAIANSAISTLHYELERIVDPDDVLKKRYESEYEEIRDIADATVRDLKKILKDQSRPTFSTGHRMGRLDCKAVARSEFFQDGKIFRRKNQSSKSEITFSLLIDESGSMTWDGKLNTARKTAILLESVLRNLHVPFMITGHRQKEYHDVTIDYFKDFESVDDNDHYRLETIRAEGGNADGLAIAYNCEKLLQRNEKQKILIVISDGIPAACGLGDQDEQVQLAIDMVDKYRKKGIEIFGVVIDGEIDKIKEIYGEQTMDCTNIGMLQSELCGLVKRFIVR